ncbi:hypothetical protein [Streptacidiphilus melanogenes]|uniref:hypothetical protein n=1 Tax=Streptacidiphilus melanogenes TaxID=411235 RepID=UPI0005A8BD25|nr:hypothetical protein [Streptacidiphilus melanogenes]
MFRYTYSRRGDGGVELRFSLSPAEARALTPPYGWSVGEDAVELGDFFDTVLETLIMLRTGRVSRRSRFPVPAVDDWSMVITNAFVDLLPRLEGLGEAAVRIARGLGMSHADIALSMNVTRSTAQSRVRKVTGRPATEFETWALRGDPGKVRARFRPMEEGPSEPPDFALD